VIPLTALAGLPACVWSRPDRWRWTRRRAAPPLAGGEVLDYDLLSLDTGPVMDRDAIPGAREHALFVRPMEHFVTRFEALLQRAAGRPLDLAVVGAGAAGVEIALALAHRLQRLDSGSRVSLVAGADGPLTGYPKRATAGAAALQARRNVTVLPHDGRAIEAGRLILATAGEPGTRVACDGPAGHSAPWRRPG
jgi:NADH dehydrogenase FAD-containing subunit